MYFLLLQMKKLLKVATVITTTILTVTTTLVINLQYWGEISGLVHTSNFYSVRDGRPGLDPARQMLYH